MKNLILTLLTVFACSFSFAQSNVSEEKKSNKEYAELKNNSVTLVRYLSKELNLEGEQKSILFNAFSRYASDMAKLNEKFPSKDTARNKAKVEMMQKLIKERDKMIVASLNDKQVKHYEKLNKSFDQMTLKIKDAKSNIKK